MVKPSDLEYLCERCNHINLEDLKEADGYVHQPLFKAFVDSVSNCILCKLIAEACVYYLHKRRMNINVTTGNLGLV